MTATVVTEELAGRLAAVRGVVFDIDGCLALFDPHSNYTGFALPGAVELVRAVRHSGRSLVAFTNASSKTPAAISETLRGLGIDVNVAEVLTPSVVAAEVVRKRFGDQLVLAFGGPGLVDVLIEEGVQVVDHSHDGQVAAVVIGWDTAFTRDRLQRAAEALWDGAELLVTSDARRFASRGRPVAGLSGFIASGLRHVTGTSYEVLGKPSPTAMEIAARRLSVAPSEVLTVGDDLTLESRMAKAAGAVAVLVTTGTHRAEDVVGAPEGDRPDLVVAGLDELIALWPGLRRNDGEVA
ncbi:HAD-IIA family hydrolase [Sphaerisporangium perillae]|uniref:HAD-IIA family hydrolase n=1 Tax=Sphaerisporangium perillae TaxID=2935860 RepID=UPI00200BC04A|nr:HAD family hydrolase [Sphaerisporangium perillae]